MPCEVLRDKILNGSITHEDMSEEDYERLIKNEAKFDNPNLVIMEFCIDGLKRYDNYKGLADVVIMGQFVYEHVEKRREKRKKAQRIIAAFRRAAVACIAVLSVLVVATYTVGSFGYNIVDLSKNFFLFLSEKEPTQRNDKKLIRSEDLRVYNSFEEMLKAEKLKIFYPSKLPDGYTFTNFEVTDNIERFSVLAYISEPYLSYRAEIGTSQIQPDSYLYEINGIKYNFIEFENGLYQADWFSDDGNDYYSIATDNQAVISEIIENLKES